MKLEFRSKNAIVYQQLRKSIINGEYAPGARLVIDQVAAELGVSQIPIREAVRQLESDGFLITEPYTGTTVTEINANLIFEIFALLESMEIICGRAACQRINNEELDKLAALVDQMDASVTNPEKWTCLNKEFHLAMGEYSRSFLAKEMLRKTLDHWDRLRFHYLKDVFCLRIKDAQREHRQIIEALRARDPDGVEALLRTHDRMALASYIAYLRKKGELPTDGSH